MTESKLPAQITWGELHRLFLDRRPYLARSISDWRPGGRQSSLQIWFDNGKTTTFDYDSFAGRFEAKEGREDLPGITMNAVVAEIAKARAAEFEKWVGDALSNHGIEIPEDVSDDQLKELVDRHKIGVEEREGFYELKVGGGTIAKRPHPPRIWRCFGC